MNIIQNLAENWPVLFVGLFLIILVVQFFADFFRTSVGLRKELNLAIKQLQEIRATVLPGTLTNLEQITQHAFAPERFAHLWREYKETLHPQRAVNAEGQEQIVKWRATVMAEAFFTQQALVDTPLKTDYYKHLPGLLTGLGIIGTFSGLINGLNHFEVSSKADVVRNGLQNLIHSVGHAFLVSACAIFFAMLLTFIEKFVVAGLYSRVEKVYQLIDTFFDAGAGEEYLSRLVHASETSATQALQLKDALVSDLKEILSNIAAQQVQDSKQSSQLMSQHLAEAISDSLRDPMDKITQVVQNVGSSQGDAVNKLLTDVLASFSSQMHDMFGGQLNGMNELLGQTSLTLQNTSARFEQLVESMQHASAGAADKMAEQLQEVLNSLEIKQSAMANQMQGFVEQMRLASRETQNETSRKMQSMLTDLGEKMSMMVEQLDNQSKLSAGSHEKQLGQLSASMDEFLSNLRMMVADSQNQTSHNLRESLGQIGAQVNQMMSQMDEQTAHSSQAQNENLVRMTERFETFLQSAETSVKASHHSSTQANQKAIENLGVKVQETMNSLQEMTKQSEEASMSRNRELAEQTANTSQAQNENLIRMTQRFEAFLQSAETSVKASHHSTTQASQKAIEDLGLKVQETINNLLEITRQSEAASMTRNRELAEQTATLIASLASQVETLGRRVAEAAESSRTSAALVNTASKDAIERMNSGAEILSSASGELAETERRVAATMNAIAQSSNALQTSSSTLSTATGGVQTALNDYKLMTSTFAKTVAELQQTIETARKEASLTTELVASLQRASQSLSGAQVEADRYLQSVTDVLGKAHGEFAEHVNATLRKVNAQFHEELSGAVGYLSTGVRDLGETLESVLDRN